jgi:MFS family permease
VRIPETRPVHHPRAPLLQGLVRVFHDGPYVAFLLLHLVVLVVFTQFQLAAPLDYAAHGVGPVAFSFLMALNGILVVLLQPLVAPKLQAYDGARVLALSTLLVGVGYGLNWFAGSVPAYVAACVLYTVGEVLGFPVASAIVADLAPADLRGRYQGAFSMIWGLAFTLSPLIGGEVLHRWGGRTLWVGCLVTCLVIAAAHLAAGPARRRRLNAIRAAEAVATPARL